MKEGPLPAMAPISGDGTKGAYEGYLKLPAGFESPPHSHTNEYWSVLVQGKMTHWAAEGGSEKEAKVLGVGDLTHMPAKLVHISKCFPGVDCIMVTMQKGKFDFIVAKATAKKDEKAAPGLRRPRPRRRRPDSRSGPGEGPCRRPRPRPGRRHGRPRQEVTPSGAAASFFVAALIFPREARLCRAGSPQQAGWARGRGVPLPRAR